METYIILGILALMVIAVVSGKFAFAVPPMATVTLMALAGVDYTRGLFLLYK